MKQGFDYIGVTTSFFCYNGRGKLLLHKRSQSCRDERGRWDCGGGALRFGETWEDGVKREIREEYCCRPLRLDHIGFRNVLRRHDGRKTHWIAILFAVKVNPKEVKIGNKRKMDEIGWFAPDHLPKPLHSMYLPQLQYVKDAGII